VESADASLQLADLVEHGNHHVDDRGGCGGEDVGDVGLASSFGRIPHAGSMATTFERPLRVARELSVSCRLRGTRTPPT
jgi:hypothetical protein